MDINLWGPVLPALIFGKSIADNGRGSIIYITPVSTDRTLTKVLGYSMSKSAVESFNKWFDVELANRYGDSIRMDVLKPGFFWNEQDRTLLTNDNGGSASRGQLVIKHTPF